LAFTERTHDTRDGFVFPALCAGLSADRRHTDDHEQHTGQEILRQVSAPKQDEKKK